MIQPIKATFRGGAFIPQSVCDLPEDAQVDLLVLGSAVQHAPVTDSAERSMILSALIERMQGNVIPADAPRFSRDQLHERR
jgi:hypothetical protein